MSLGACPVDETLTELVEGRLSTESAAELHRHVRDCADCRQVLAGLGQALEAEGHSLEATQVSSRRAIGLPRLAAGDRVGRFQIERRVGEGGMGTVYAARDPELGRAVAVKLLRVSATSDEDTAGRRSRLLREAQAMARLAHPNVLTVFEVGTWNEQVFLAMELIEGGTLKRWLADRPRPWKEVFDIFLDAGRGLAAAHAAGLVHRDFKTDNVLLGTDGRARVMDFGLARPFTEAPDAAAIAVSRPPAGASKGSDLTNRLTRTGALLGTPAYMAPEQMRAEPVDARADLFGFCSSFYEALYGQRAFNADSLAELQRKIEANDVSPPPPDRSVPSWVRRELLRGLRADPAERHATMDELLTALTRSSERRARRRNLLALAAVAALVAVLVPVGLRIGARPPQTTAGVTTSAAARRAVAVLTLRNLTARPETAWLSSALAEMMSTEMAASRQLRVIPGENVALAMSDLGLTDAKAPVQDVLRRLGANLGADLVLSGSFSALEPAQQLRLDLRLQNAGSGEAVADVAEVGEQAKLFDLVARAGAKLRRELGVGSPEPDPSVQVSFPANPEAARLFSEGLVRLRAFDPKAARESLEGGAKIEPKNPRILAALAQAYTGLGEEERAGDAARRAFEAAESLPRDERLSIEGLYRRTTKDRQRAVEIGRALVTFFPDDIDYGLRLGYDQVNASDRAGALATVQALHHLAPPADADPRIDLLEAWAGNELDGDPKRSRKAAARAVAAGRANGARQVVAWGRYNEGVALRRLGDPPGAAAALGEAEKLSHEIGDRRYEAFAVMQMANLLKDQGDLPAAQERMEAALAIFRQLGNRNDATALCNLGVVQRSQRRLAEAVQRSDEAIAAYRQSGDRRGIAASFLHRGNLLRDQGDLEKARQSFEASLASYRDLGVKEQAAGALIGLAGIAVERAELAQAQKLFREAKELQPPGEKSHTSGALWGLAEVALEEGRFEEAEALLKQSGGLMRELGRVDDLATTEALRARALLGMGQREKAARAVAEAKALLAQSKAPLARPAVAIAEARVAAAERSPGLNEALGTLDELLDEARASGAVTDGLYLRLALAELSPNRDALAGQQLQSLASDTEEQLSPAGDTATEDKLQTLASDALARGFLLVARKAEAALKQPERSQR